MRADDIPVATVAGHPPAPAAVSPYIPPTSGPASAGPPPLSVFPVTPEEAAAIARRIRVEARLPRVTLIGTVLGLVCGVAAIWPFLDSDGYMADVLVRDGLGVFAFLPGWLLTGLLPLLAFYAGRLHFQTGRSSTGEIEADLRKIRRIILAGMFAAVMAFVFVLAQEGGHSAVDGNSAPRLTFLYLAAFAGCAAIIGDVRRGLGDYDSEHQRRRRKLARGFTVELRGANADVTPVMSAAAAAAPPLANVAPAEPPALVDAIPVARAMSPSPAPFSVAPAVVRRLETVEEDEHFKDLRLLMAVAILAAVLLHACRMGEGMYTAMETAEHLAVAGPAVLTGQPLGGGGGFTFVGGGAGGGFGGVGGAVAVASPLMTLVTLLGLAASVLLLPCGLAWIVWGMPALSFGPALRRTVHWLTVLTLVLSVLAVAPAWLFGPVADEVYVSARLRLSYLMPQRLGRAPEIVHCLFIGLLLTRPGVKRLFARSSEADDGGDDVTTARR